MSQVPKELTYSKEHVWVKKEDNQVRIGVTHFAQEELGDIVFAELPEAGDELTANEPFGNVESVKTVSELYAPISGQVVEVNANLDDSPELVNESPYEKAWMLLIKPSKEAELDELMQAEQYEEMISQE
ncbi:glycine cleavage system protein GcvH [Halalkalibacter hemicellulosilyticus]|uniref:Glycine cleavage system H protein n=1 Tax=Halalkalibacter hemicellulosilyticusJCM 9152 TaxID=1236971 RepID=W4QDZ2_9BACI|nr:glycine cleavage system protein GcvH [Halalkalibacter hemicellulosilyticus]GAE30275.1 glycine cleavage system H protein [Halalkalibacter hemicellulosilyticusJCM 9152]